MNRIIAFKDLRESSQNLILGSSMVSDLDIRLSFGLVDDNNSLLGYSLLKPDSIDSNIEFHIDGFDKSEYACRIIELKEMGNNNPHIFALLCKYTIERVQIWNDKDKGAFKYLWAIPKDSYDVCYMANCLDCEQVDFLEDEYTKKTIIYNIFSKDENDELNAPE